MASDFITRVSGVPRSGTSMMMQALEAGGLQPLTDNIRKPDEDNPKGYYEFEPVKKTKDDPTWLKNAPGRVVKMIYRLLYDLPPEYRYRVIFMQRDFAEMLTSQKKMLDRNGKQVGQLSDERMIKAFQKQLADFNEWIASQESFSILTIDYTQVIEDPLTEFKRINDFLGGALDTAAMAQVVDPALYRNRKD